MSKAIFIELAREAGVATKTERALYKNLEALETRKLITYLHKTLALTPKGEKAYAKLVKTLGPYFVSNKIAQGIHYAKKGKTVLTS